MPGSSVETRYLDVAQLATYLGRTPKAIYRLVDKGQIPSIRLGKKLQFDKEKIDRWMERHSQRGVSL